MRFSFLFLNCLFGAAVLAYEAPRRGNSGGGDSGGRGSSGSGSGINIGGGSGHGGNSDPTGENYPYRPDCSFGTPPLQAGEIGVPVCCTRRFAQLFKPMVTNKCVLYDRSRTECKGTVGCCVPTPDNLPPASGALGFLEWEMTEVKKCWYEPYDLKKEEEMTRKKQQRQQRDSDGKGDQGENRRGTRNHHKGPKEKERVVIPGNGMNSGSGGGNGFLGEQLGGVMQKVREKVGP